VRTENDEKSLRREYGGAVTVLWMDVTDPATVAASSAEVRAAGPLNGLVNNAGVALPGSLELLPLELLRRQLDVNLIGQLAVTQAMLPSLRLARAQGEVARIVMVGSVSGRIARPMTGAYDASKFGLVGLSDTLRAELAPAAIDVVLIEPGAIRTAIWHRGLAPGDELLVGLSAEEKDRYAAQIERATAEAAHSVARGLPPERVARVVVMALTARHPRPRYLVGRDARLAAAVARLPFRLRYQLTAAKR
jgi:NAD(P)-dependent dehydrogenase (short-subunit alcohol dehydrogenase family)